MYENFSKLYIGQYREHVIMPKTLITCIRTIVTASYILTCRFDPKSTIMNLYLYLPKQIMY